MRFRLQFAAILLASTLSTTPAAAQSSDAQRALKLAYEGDNLYAKSQWADAYERFSAADTIAHSPVFVLYMARCRKNAGKLREARALYERVAREDVGPAAPKPFREAVADATKERDDVGRRIPSLLVVVTGKEASSATVRVDHSDVPDAKKAIEVDPGTHEVLATAGALTAHKEVRVEDGAGTVRVELSLAPANAALAPRNGGKAGSLVPGVVALSVGLVGAGVGAVTGLLASSKASDVKSRCVDGHCLKSDADELATSRTMATVSTVGFIVAGAGAAGAIVLFAVRPGAGPADAAWVRPVIGPGWLGAHGVF